MIQFYPKAGQVLICDYDTGFQPPEMIKKRKVVIISPKSYNKSVCCVVPLSTKQPRIQRSCHIELDVLQYSFLSQDKRIWAKCDMISHVSLHRLDRLRIGRSYETPSITNDDLQKIRYGVTSAIGLILTNI